MLRTFFHPVTEFIERNSGHKQLGEMIKGFGKAFGALQLATAQIAAKGMADPEEAGAPRQNTCVYLASWLWALCGSGRR